MPRGTKIADEMEFVGKANKTDNVWGNFSCERVTYYNDFVSKAIDSTNVVTVTTVNSGTATVTVPHMMTVTTNNQIDDNTEVAWGVEWYPEYDCAMEVRFRADIPTNSAFFLGFTDAVTEGADGLPFEIEATLLASTANDVVGLVYDLDSTTDRAFFVSSKNTSDGQAFPIGSAAPTASQLYTMRVELRDIGDTTIDANFYFNSSGKEIDPVRDHIGVEHDAVTNSTPLCPYIGLLSRTANACTLDVDYVKFWQDRR